MLNPIHKRVDNTGKLSIKILLPNPSAFPNALKCIGILIGNLVYDTRIKIQCTSIKTILNPSKI